MITNWLWILFAHYIGDYPLQGDFLATTKGKYIYSLFAHSFIYVLPITWSIRSLESSCNFSQPYDHRL